MDNQNQPIVHLVTDDEVKGKAKELFQEITKSTGHVPKWMRVMANNPDILIGFFTMFRAIMDDAPLDKKLKWKIALIISDLNKCEFCVSIAKQQLKTYGLSEKEFESVESERVDEKEKIAIEYAKASTNHAYNIDPHVLSKVKKFYSDEQIVELSSVVGLFNFINRFNDSLGVLPDIR